MDLETFLVAVYCVTDDALHNVLHGMRLRQRGPAPRLRGSEVVAMGVSGEFLGIETDDGIYRYFRRHWPGLYPRLRTVHRTTFLRQAVVERYHAKRSWARDLRHLCSRWLRKVLSHTTAVLLCQQHGLDPLSFRQLIAS